MKPEKFKSDHHRKFSPRPNTAASADSPRAKTQSVVSAACYVIAVDFVRMMTEEMMQWMN